MKVFTLCGLKYNALRFSTFDARTLTGIETPITAITIAGGGGGEQLKFLCS